MRIALFDNINNNQYLLARFLHSIEVAADLYLPKQDFCTATPEWEECAFAADVVPNRYPKWAWLKVQNEWNRPTWIKEMPDLTWYRLPHAEWDPWIKEQEWKLNGRMKWRQHNVVNAALRGLGINELSFHDTSRFFDIERWARVARGYDLIQVQSYSVINCLLRYPSKPYVILDYGQPLRSIVFEESTQGRLFRAAYQLADAVVLLNPDTRDAAEKLGLKNYHFIGHPVDEEKYSPGSSPVRTKLEESYGRDVMVVFAPARLEPAEKGIDKVLRAFSLLTSMQYGQSAVLILIRWGDVEGTKRLIAELGIESKVVWSELMSRTLMRDYYRAADVILDQFVLDTPGRICFEGMACGKPIVTSFSSQAHAWCYPEPPPLCSSFGEKEILGWLEKLIREPALRKELGWRGRRWIEKYFTGERTARAYVDLYRNVLERGRQKALEQDRLRFRGR